jgi:GNAT superfamily N-acetyltransferase
MSQEFKFSQITNHDDGLIVVRVDPRDLSFELSTEVAELLLLVYENDPIFNYWLGPQYRYGESGVKLINETTESAVKRAEKYVDMNVSYRRLLYSYGRFFHSAFTSDRAVLYLAYLPNSSEQYDDGVGDETQPLVSLPSHGKLVGAAGLTYPMFMPSTIPQTIWWKLYRYWLSFKYRILNVWSFIGTGEHPSFNERRQSSDRDMENSFKQLNAKNIDQLAAMTSQEVADAVYGTDAVPWLQPMIVDPKLQGRGIGTKLLNTVYGQFQHGSQVTFESSDGKHRSTGPLKIVLDASQNGFGLYKKFGFQPLVVCSLNIANSDDPVTFTRMMRIW